MTLLDLCEPFFLYTCRLNRSARLGVSTEYNRVRAEVRTILKELKNRAASDPKLSAQFAKMELPLIFFIDSMIADSNLSFRDEWHENRLAYERNELAGDERFWVLLDETLADRSAEATERIAVFYTCIGLGFVGDHVGEPEELRNKMSQCAARLAGLIDLDEEEERICPEAYHHVNTSVLFQPPGAKLLGIGIALIGLIIVLFIANIILYDRASRRLRTSLERIEQHQTMSAPVSPKPGARHVTETEKES